MPVLKALSFLNEALVMAVLIVVVSPQMREGVRGQGTTRFFYGYGPYRAPRAAGY